MKERVLIVEDERPMRTALADALAAEGYRVLTAENGAAALERALREAPALMLLDVMMPKLDGFAVCAAVRKQRPQTAILMLTAKGQVADRVKGLDSGADDYLVKPFSTEELLARVRALLRRAERQERGLRRIALGEVEVDFAALTMSRVGQPVRCTAKELAVLRLLAEHAGEAVTREQFLDAVWGCNAFPTTRTVDNHMAMLRGKVEPDPEKPRFIQTVHGVGYRLAEFAER